LRPAILSAAVPESADIKAAAYGFRIIF